jgi:nitrogen-specific signal transduction histidine kinase
MAAVIAHEVKNPLAGIPGAIQVIGGRLPADSRDASVLSDMVIGNRENVGRPRQRFDATLDSSGTGRRDRHRFHSLRSTNGSNHA